MTRDQKLAFKIIGAYIFGSFLTFGWSYNRVECSSVSETFSEESKNEDCRIDKEIGSTFKGLIWPIYVAGKISIYVTKPLF